MSAARPSKKGGMTTVRKANIQKVDGVWRVTRPAFGFNSTPIVRDFPTQKAAMRWFMSGAAGSAGPQIERASTPTPRWCGEAWFPIVR